MENITLKINASKELVSILNIFTGFQMQTTKIFLLKYEGIDNDISCEYCILDNSDDIVEKVFETVTENDNITYSKTTVEAPSYEININNYDFSCEFTTKFIIIPNNFNQWRNTITKLKQKTKDKFGKDLF